MECHPLSRRRGVTASVIRRRRRAQMPVSWVMTSMGFGQALPRRRGERGVRGAPRRKHRPPSLCHAPTLQMPESRRGFMGAPMKAKRLLGPFRGESGSVGRHWGSGAQPDHRSRALGWRKRGFSERPGSRVWRTPPCPMASAPLSIGAEDVRYGQRIQLSPRLAY